jgi:hypothetical protein
MAAKPRWIPGFSKTHSQILLSAKLINKQGENMNKGRTAILTCSMTLMYFGCTMRRVETISADGTKSPVLSLTRDPAHRRPTGVELPCKVFIKQPDLATIILPRHKQSFENVYRNGFAILANTFETHDKKFVITNKEEDAEIIVSCKIMAIKTSWPPWRLFKNLFVLFGEDDSCTWAFTFTQKNKKPSLFSYTYTAVPLNEKDVMIIFENMVKSIDESWSDR